MKGPILIWSIAAVGASALLVGVLVRQYPYTQARWSALMAGDPQSGWELFFGKAKCAHCHAVNGAGGKLAGDLSALDAAQAGVSQLAGSMWNHAPRMFELMRAEKMNLPALRPEEVANLFAFLNSAACVDGRGDPSRGQSLFETKGCVACHSVRGRGGKAGPDLAGVRAGENPVRWAQGMWNHAPDMRKPAGTAGVTRPRFDGRDMNDLLAFVTAGSGVEPNGELYPADPKRGWDVFRAKSCINCHAVKGKGGRLGPELGPSRRLPLTVVQFSALMWNHAPQMWRAAETMSIPRPTLEGQEIADLVAFLGSLRFLGPAGSPHVGRTAFAERGCDSCHGESAQGGRGGPALRGRGQSATTITLATALFNHGPRMYDHTRRLGQSWPELQDDDAADIIAFLNSSPQDDENTRRDRHPSRH